jgi:hypothetical protein
MHESPGKIMALVFRERGVKNFEVVSSFGSRTARRGAESIKKRVTRRARHHVSLSFPLPLFTHEPNNTVLTI